MTRPHSPTSSSAGLTVAIALLVVVLVATAVPSGAYSTAGLDRTSGIDVVSDTEGIYGLEKSDTVSVASTDPLVRITNTRSASTSVTVALQRPPDGVELSVNGTGHGETYSFELASEDARLIELRVPDESALDGTDVYYDVSVSDPPVSLAASDRRTTIQA